MNLQKTSMKKWKLDELKENTAKNWLRKVKEEDKDALKVQQSML